MGKKGFRKKTEYIDCLDEDGWHIEKSTPSKKRSWRWLLCLLLLIPCISFTYSSYVTEAKGNPNMKVATWKFEINSTGSTKLNIDLADTIIANNFSTTTVIPGTKGKIALDIDFSSTKVATEYQILLDKNNTVVPSALKFYSDAAMTVEFTGFQGNILLKDIDKLVQKNIYWQWDYTSVDETNTWTNKEIKLGLVAQAKQKVS